LAFFNSTGFCAPPYWKLKPLTTIFFEQIESERDNDA